MPEKPERTRSLEEALSAIADGTPLAWRDLESGARDPVQLEVLRLLEDVARAFRNDPAGAPGPPRRALFRWGPLEAEAQIGSGSYAEVYRAYDPWLGRHVALKLSNTASRLDNSLDEARRLAQLRHRNVLAVYGCAVHDGRTGLWSELIEGRTLAAIVAADGPMDVAETTRIGIDLARALAVVHAVGLVHGDVKADNAMREASGRIVLMDFGAAGEQRLQASRRLISGTVRYLPPEVLDGAPLSVASDIYALGVLLYFLRRGYYPYRQTEAAALREAQRHGGLPAPPLHSTADRQLQHVIDRCLAADPGRRPGSAAEVADTLSAFLARPAATAVRQRRFRVAAGIAAIALIAVAVLWNIRIAAPPWQADAHIVRIDANGERPLPNGATVRAGERVRLHWTSNRRTYVYVLDEDSTGHTSVLFPLNGTGPANPLTAAAGLNLPGGSERPSLAWQIDADAQREEFVVVASLQPLPMMDTALADWTRLREETPSGERGVSGLVDDAEPVLPQGEQLRRLLEKLPKNRSAVRVWRFALRHGP